MPPIPRLLETAIYVADVRASRDWYARVFGLTPLNPDHDERLCPMGLPGAQVLLIFLKGGTTDAVHLPGGTIPPHDASGRIHLAFAIDAAQLEPWRVRLATLDIRVEGEVKWDRGGTSLYFRDPDGHLVELATPGLWPTY